MRNGDSSTAVLRARVYNLQFHSSSGEPAVKRILAFLSLLLAFTLIHAQTAPAPQVTGPSVAKTPESVIAEPDSDTAQKEKEKEKPGAAEKKPAAKAGAAKEEKKEEKKDEKKDGKKRQD